MDDKVHDEASNVVAVQGVVILDGPDGVAVTLTSAAAEKTGDRLIEAAIEAHGQCLRAADTKSC